MFTCDEEVLKCPQGVFSNKGENLTLDNSILDAADVSPYDTGRDNIGRDSGITDAGLSTEKRYINIIKYIYNNFLKLTTSQLKKTFSLQRFKHSYSDLSRHYTHRKYNHTQLSLK